ncbi:hypothetical protein ACOME3_009541 [Neoechinorhynchus agilis]
MEKGAELGPSSESFQVMISEKIGQYGKRSGAWSFLRIISGYDIREDWAVWKKERSLVFLRIISGYDIREDWAVWKKERSLVFSESFQVMISEKIGQYGKRSGAWSFLRIISGYDIREDWAVWKKERSLVLPQNHFRLGSMEKGAELGLSSESFQVMISEKIGQYGKRSGAWSFLRIISGYDIREDWAVWKKERSLVLPQNHFRL